MANKWFKRFREQKQLAVWNKAKSWAGPVAAAIKTFNDLAFGLKLVVAAEEKDTKIMIVLAAGPMTDTGPYGEKVETGPKFKADGLHGHCHALVDKRNEIYFAGVFIPANVAKTNSDQKLVVVLHELIHACGMDEHDQDGIMFDSFQPKDDGLIELRDADKNKGVKAMPPIRVGAKTSCIMKMLWSDGDACTND